MFGCTSAGSLFGLTYDATVCAKLGYLAGCPPQGVVSAVSDALGRVGAKRIAVITPYIDDLTQSVAKAIKIEGREHSRNACLLREIAVAITSVI